MTAVDEAKHDEAIEIARRVVEYSKDERYRKGLVAHQLATALLAADQRLREMAAVVEAAKAWRATYEKPRDAMNWDAENAWTRVRLGDAIDAMTAARGAGRERP
jgi:hypothetical protein